MQVTKPHRLQDRPPPSTEWCRKELQLSCKKVSTPWADALELAVGGVIPLSFTPRTSCLPGPVGIRDICKLSVVRDRFSRRCHRQQTFVSEVVLSISPDICHRGKNPCPLPGVSVQPGAEGRNWGEEKAPKRGDRGHLVAMMSRSTSPPHLSESMDGWAVSREDGASYLSHGS